MTSDAELLRTIAEHGYHPEYDPDGSTQRQLLGIAETMEATAARLTEATGKLRAIRERVTVLGRS
jgi:hypothetical protein